MEVSRLRSALDAEFTFPVHRKTLLESVGNVELDGVAAESETVATVLERTDERTFASSQALYETLVGSVPDGYVGRKYYDDRSGASPDVRRRTAPGTLDRSVRSL